MCEAMHEVSTNLKGSPFREACHLVQGGDQVWQLLLLASKEAAQVGQALLLGVVQLEEQQELVRGSSVQGPALRGGHF